MQTMHSYASSPPDSSDKGFSPNATPSPHPLLLASSNRRRSVPFLVPFPSLPSLPPLSTPSLGTQVGDVIMKFEPFTTSNGLITQTLKTKRNVVVDKFSKEIDALYATKR